MCVYSVYMCIHVYIYILCVCTYIHTCTHTRIPNTRFPDGAEGHRSWDRGRGTGEAGRRVSVLFDTQGSHTRTPNPLAGITVHHAKLLWMPLEPTLPSPTPALLGRSIPPTWTTRSWTMETLNENSLLSFSERL